MNGFSVDPGERTARRHIDLPGAAVVEIIGRADPRQHVAARIVDREDGDGNIRAQARPRGRAPAPRAPSASLRIQRQRNDRRILHRRRWPIGGMRRQDRHRLAQPRHRHGLGAAPHLPRDTRAVLDHAVEHAVARDPRGIPDNGRAGGFPAIAATPPAAPIPPATSASAPCRNRRSRRRECPRDCRRKAPAPDTDRGSGPCSFAARSRARAPSGCSLA